MRPFSGVNPNVTFKKRRTVEGLAAIIARQHVLFAAPNRGGRFGGAVVVIIRGCQGRRGL